jgi:hypothetical protein
MSSYINKWVFCKKLYYQDENITIDELDLVFPDDVQLVKTLVGIGMAKCVGVQSEYLILDNTEVTVRVKEGAVSRVLPDPKFDLNEAVREIERPEVKGTIGKLLWHDKLGDFMYHLRIGKSLKSRRYNGEELERIPT